MRDTNGSWWPTMTESFIRPASFKPMTPPRATIAVPMAPNATGAVFATRQIPAA